MIWAILGCFILWLNGVSPWICLGIFLLCYSIVDGLAQDLEKPY